MNNFIMPPKQVVREIKILFFDDGSVQVTAPTDFLLFRDIMNKAERAVINNAVQQRSRIIKPELKAEIIPGGQ